MEMADSMAVQKFKEGYNCAQSVMFNYIDRTGLSADFALRLATGFGAGMGRKQEVCGAISGGILVINCLFGRGANEDKSGQDKAYAKVRQLIDRFTEESGTINCKKLLGGCDLLTDDGRKRFNDERLIETCHSCVDRVVKLLDEIIAE